MCGRKYFTCFSENDFVDNFNCFFTHCVAMINWYRVVASWWQVSFCGWCTFVGKDQQNSFKSIPHIQCWIRCILHSDTLPVGRGWVSPPASGVSVLTPFLPHYREPLVGGSTPSGRSRPLPGCPVGPRRRLVWQGSGHTRGDWEWS